MKPIGTFHADSKYPYEARRQASADTNNSFGEIRLEANSNFEQALEDLEGFERIWIIYLFHQNEDWKPKVIPPRGPRVKRGVFATRAPYRPNPIGMSCVKLVKVDGLTVVIEGHDILDGTPVLDIKPYLPYADSFPDSKVGWLADIESERREVRFSKRTEKQIRWLEKHGVTQLRGFAQAQLEFDPLDHKRKRVEAQPGGHRLAYRTWRIDFSIESDRHVNIECIRSGYSKFDLDNPIDRYEDKALHRQFILAFD